MRLTLEEKEYLGGMCSLVGNWEGYRWFMEEDLQIVARLNRRGIVVLDPDYEGFNVMYKGDRAFAERHFSEWRSLYLARLRGKPPSQVHSGEKP